MRRPSAALILIISLLITGLAVAGPFEDATKAYNRGDFETTYRLFKTLAEQGLPEAQYNLGIMYSKGQAVPQDYAEVAKWYRKSADQGNQKAQFNLGRAYSNGEGVPQDYLLAHMWLNLAASLFPSSEGEYRETAVKNRNLVAAKMTPAQIAEAQRLAREWKPKKER